MIICECCEVFAEMDRFRQKSKKEKAMKYVDKDQAPLFITDVKAMKENLKIKEILRTVKMNSSMRIKAPKGSKVMQNKDFNDNEDIFGADGNSGEQKTDDPNITQALNATNPDVVLSNNSNEDTNQNKTEETVDNNNESEEELITDTNEDTVDTKIHESISVPEGLSDFVLINEENKQNIEVVPEIKIDLPLLSENSHVKARDRKLSLDQTMLSRRGGLSQSELDLNSIGKSPLERKSSFFRKKMDSFLKNTTEIFKRQSVSRSQSVQRRGSMSVSLQSLNENTTSNSDFGEPLHNHQEELQRSRTSLQSSPTPAGSASSLSMFPSEQTLPDPQSEGGSLTGSRAALTGSQPLGDISPGIHSLNEAMLNRAISMSSGLDSATGQNRRKSRSNRVTWLASEGLTNYFRRVIQDENSRESGLGHSYQDFSSIPEYLAEHTLTDSKGRRLSYQRAVSGEDPRYHEFTIRRKPEKQIPESTEGNVTALLKEFTKKGIPELKGFNIANIAQEAFDLLHWAEDANNLENVYDWKQLPRNEMARQAVIRELIHTEADYIRYLLSIVQVFIATAHALQDNGIMLNVDTEHLFKNIPDVLNASLYFWESAIYPMMAEAIEGQAPFNTELMAPGFLHFSELLQPYEKYVSHQTKALDYLRSLSNDTDFMCYLTWCYEQHDCNRLLLSDIIPKPMQRLTKYSLLLNRLIESTDTEPERTSLQAMETCTKNFVQDINRTIRQREELEKIDNLANAIEPYEIEFKDDDFEKCFRMHSQLNLKSPMANCSPQHSRTVIYQGDLRYKDNIKEIDARVFLLTDMLLICKKLSKGTTVHHYKLARPKYFIEKLISYPRLNQRVPSIVFVAIDDVGSSCNAFSLSETREPNVTGTLKIWESKLREARLTYELAVWFTRNPSRDPTEMDVDTSSDYGHTGHSVPSASRPGAKQSSDELHIDREARERVAAMLHRSLGVSTDCDNYSQGSMYTDSFDGEFSTSHGARGFPGLRHPMKRASTGGSSRNSRLSSFQYSTSAASHDEPQSGPSNRYIYRAGSSVEHVVPAPNTEDGKMSITVNVVSEGEEPDTDTVIVHTPQPTLPMVVLQHSSPNKIPPPIPARSSSTSRNTLRVQPRNGVMALVHSLPDLTMEAVQPIAMRTQPPPSPQTASDRLYQAHHELLMRNRLSAQQQQQPQRFLSPDHRGISYPPPSPTRASLKRGLAFSYSIKNPPLSKMGHVNSQSQQAESGPSTSQGTKGEKGPSPTPGTSADQKPDKKSKHVSNRQKGGSPSPSSRQDDRGD